MKKERDCVRRLKGDGLSIEMDSNNRILEVTGDGCKITLTKNCGSVRVMGDGCRVKVTHNVGDIVYTGDGGRVLLGPKSLRERVRYIGEGGKVSFDSDDGRTIDNNEDKSMIDGTRIVQGTKKVSYVLKNHLGDDKERKLERNERRRTKKHERFDDLRGGSKLEGSFDRNDINDDKRETKSVKTTTTIFLTANDRPEDYFEVNKWFVSSTPIVRTYVENLPTTTTTVTVRGEKRNKKKERTKMDSTE